MIKYSHLVQYIKENHVNWNTDLFDVLRGFFSQYSPSPPPPSHSQSVSQELIFEHKEFNEPDSPHYTIQDLINLLET